MMRGIAVTIGMLLLAAAPLEEAAKVGYRAPTFAISDLAGKTHRLTDYAGKVILLNFWATWCTFCVDEMPDLSRLYEELGPDRFVVIGISIDYEIEEIEDFLAKTKVKYPVYFDAGQKVSRLYRATRLPITYLIDAEGRIVEIVVGPREWTGKAWKSKIQRLMQQTAGAVTAPTAAPVTAPSRMGRLDDQPPNRH